MSTIGKGDVQTVHGAGGVELESQVVGTGDPVILIHGSLIADAFAPLLTETALRNRFQLISYYRRGYLGSTHPDRPLSISEQAADCVAVMDHFGAPRAHVVGHSYGGLIALQLALDAPDRVHSLALLEAAITSVPSIQPMMDGIVATAGLHQQGKRAEAVDMFETAVAGPDYRRILDERIPGAFAQMVADSDTVFTQELAAFQTWSFTADDAARIHVPTLVVLGENSGALWPGFPEGYALLQQWLPQAEGFVLAGATHALQMQNPSGMAEALSDFLARHPMAVPA